MLCAEAVIEESKEPPLSVAPLLDTRWRGTRLPAQPLQPPRGGLTTPSFSKYFQCPLYVLNP